MGSTWYWVSATKASSKEGAEIPKGSRIDLYVGDGLWQSDFNRFQI